MTEEVPKNHGFLKFIVIFMGILIALGLIIMVWKVIDLARERAARQEQQAVVEAPGAPVHSKVTLAAGEEILGISAGPHGLWIRIGRAGITGKMILVDRAGKIIRTIRVEQNNEIPAPAN